LPRHGFDFDPLAGLANQNGKKIGEAYLLADQRLTGFGTLVFAARLATNLLSTAEQRTVFLPAACLTAMKEEALHELVDQGQDDSANKELSKYTPNKGLKPFLGDGDVICAWWTKLAMRYLPTTSTRTVVIPNAFDIRKPFSTDLFPSTKVYIHNATYSIITLLPTCEILTNPLNYIAAAIRQSIVEQGTTTQMTALAALSRASIKSTNYPSLFGDPTCHLMICSNWSKAEYFF
jgi:hypothetical protein